MMYGRREVFETTPLCMGNVAVKCQNFFNIVLCVAQRTSCSFHVGRSTRGNQREDQSPEVIAEQWRSKHRGYSSQILRRPSRNGYPRRIVS